MHVMVPMEAILTSHPSYDSMPGFVHSPPFPPYYPEVEPPNKAHVGTISLSFVERCPLGIGTRSFVLCREVSVRIGTRSFVLYRAAMAKCSPRVIFFGPWPLTIGRAGPQKSSVF